MGGAHSRRKGHQFERDIANRLKPIFPGAKRQLEYQIDDCVGVDIANTGPYKFQCKKYRGYVPVNTIFEIQCDQALGDIPVLITAADAKPAMAVLPLDDLLRLIAAQEPRRPAPPQGAPVVDQGQGAPPTLDEP